MSRNVETAMKNFIEQKGRVFLNVLLKYCEALKFASDKILLYQNTSLPNRKNNKNELGSNRMHFMGQLTVFVSAGFVYLFHACHFKVVVFSQIEWLIWARWSVAF